MLIRRAPCLYSNAQWLPASPVSIIRSSLARTQECYLVTQKNLFQAWSLSSVKYRWRSVIRKSATCANIWQIFFAREINLLMPLHNPKFTLATPQHPNAIAFCQLQKWWSIGKAFKSSDISSTLFTTSSIAMSRQQLSLWKLTICRKRHAYCVLQILSLDVMEQTQPSSW